MAKTAHKDGRAPKVVLVHTQEDRDSFGFHDRWVRKHFRSDASGEGSFQMVDGEREMIWPKLRWFVLAGVIIAVPVAMYVLI